MVRGTKKIVIIGAGGLGREVAAMINIRFSDLFKIVGFVDDGIEVGEQVNCIPVLGNVRWLNDHTEKLSVVVAIGNANSKAGVLEQLNNPMLEFPDFIHNASFQDHARIQKGMGNLVLEGCILTTNISIGNFNLINLNCTIGHDTVIGNFCSIMPGVNLSGGITLENKVYIGAGANIIKGVTLGEGCTIGAGAMVNRDVPAGKTYAGVPAKELKNG